MSYGSILVHVDRGPSSASRVAFAGAIADRFEARLIGIGVAEPAMPIVSDGVFVDERLLREAEARAREAVAEAEALFRKAAGHRNALEWRSACGQPPGIVAENARAADLVVVGRQGPGDRRDWQLGADPGDILMAAGRPVMLVPPQARLMPSRVLIAWRDTREARRAVWDGLPLLKRAASVLVLSAGPDANEEGVADVAGWLGRHGVVAETRVVSMPVDGVSEEILVQVERTGADLVVAGAYGHSRVREWMFGGVTRQLLDEVPVACLMAH